ncbi:hypothetical protein PTH_2487 [Pelotomaculum thermopropionicum SI]|uniref:Uncharacterized protein n=1 Tax=Pelotomaculum thermopropionicum (strain DSM 13744 / JCM 10971 / SI) TaxID=370438 RepID=A5CZA0_PELTS|nr:hypothetical protein PTH_2487 [Pelotomaculum thermopropionicum SI]
MPINSPPRKHVPDNVDNQLPAAQGQGRPGHDVDQKFLPGLRREHQGHRRDDQPHRHQRGRQVGQLVPDSAYFFRDIRRALRQGGPLRRLGVRRLSVNRRLRRLALRRYGGHRRPGDKCQGRQD